ncbi:MAG: hypothetical protein ACNA8P_08840 [Phycisphaerales bacterium]
MPLIMPISSGFSSHLGAQAGSSPALLDRPDWFSGAIAALGVMLITTVLLRRWVKRSRAGRERSARPISEQRQLLVHQTERDSLERLMVEVQELTRVCAAQIENRATKLEQLIELADRRIQYLDERSRQPIESSEAHRRAEQSPPRVMTNSGVSRPSRDWASEDGTHEEVRPNRDQLATRVHELSEMGLNSVEIARQLDEQVGKVELILALRNAS